MTEENFEKLVLQVDGQDVEYDILFTFTCDETGLGYVGYTDHSQDESGAEQVFVGSYDPVYGKSRLNPITTDAEWEMVSDVIEQIKNS